MSAYCVGAAVGVTRGNQASQQRVAEHRDPHQDVQKRELLHSVV